MPFCERLSVVISNGIMAVNAPSSVKAGQAGRSRLVEARAVELVP